MVITNSEMSEISLNIIIKAGNARAIAAEAVDLARKGKFAEAEEQITAAELEMNEAHQAQTEMLIKNARAVTNGEDALMPDILMVHAQDHFNAALLSIDNGRAFIALYEEIDSLKKRL